jgi:DNA (cytosine-5)-methyltransferase 1
MKHASLFSGIGGFDLAAEWMGWENVFHCEWMEFPRKVLDYYWPNADSHTDICKTDFKKYANTIDILTGGFPCQPFSLAGKRKGSDDERYLWHEMLRAIQEIKPKYVIAENVFGITNIDGGLVFEQVCLDLENEGYEVQAFIIPAASKNAPHRRDRVWFVAYSTSNGYDEQSTQRYNVIGTNNQQSRSQWQRTVEGFSNEWDVTDTKHNGLEYSLYRSTKKQKNKSKKTRRQISIPKFIESIKTISIRQNATDPDLSRCKAKRKQPNANAQNKRIEYIGCGWERFPTQSPICGGDDGLPTKLDGITFSKWRAESIKGYGNAIVPQVALEIFKVIEKIDCDLSK